MISPNKIGADYAQAWGLVTVISMTWSAPLWTPQPASRRNASVLARTKSFASPITTLDVAAKTPHLILDYALQGQLSDATRLRESRPRRIWRSPLHLKHSPPPRRWSGYQLLEFGTGALLAAIGASAISISPGYLTVIHARRSAKTCMTGVCMMPIGMGVDMISGRLAEEVQPRCSSITLVGARVAKPWLAGRSATSTAKRIFQASFS